MLSDLYVMKIDAKQELDNINSSEDIETFKKSIIVPDNISIDYLLNGERYYLTGSKGTGKTALLIYTALKAEELFDAERAFMVFKEISQEQRDEYKMIAHVTEYDQNVIEPYYDYENVWKWLIHKNISDAILSSNKIIYRQNDLLTSYLDTIAAVKTTSRCNYMPIIGKDGFVEINIGFTQSLAIKGRINFEFKKDSKNEIRFSSLVKELDSLFVSLEGEESQLYLIIDELNLSMKNNIEYERDVTMIRDLIIVIEEINRLSKNSHDNLRVICGIRTEVINSVLAKGKEINKAIESYGIPIDWTIYNDDTLNNPLIKVLINYLRLSEKQSSKFFNKSDKQIFNSWVEDYMYHKPSHEIILTNTLYKPRHIVRLLNLSKLLCPKSEKISEKTMNSIRKEYSKQCWNEAVEELIVVYNMNQISAIKNLFAGCDAFTSRALLFKKATELWSNDPELKGLISGFDDLLRTLYTVGIIGNYRHAEKLYHRWYCRGDEALILKQDITIHRIFWSVLCVTCRDRYY